MRLHTAWLRLKVRVATAKGTAGQKERGKENGRRHRDGETGREK